MGASSIHISPVKNTSESHNLRIRDFDYVRKDLTPKNFNWGFDQVKLSELRRDQEKLYQNKVGQKMQKKATPIREGVFLFEEKHTNEEILKLVQGIEKEFGIKAVQLSIHRDEGHLEPHTKVWKPNLHAHVIFDWQNKNTGKTFKLDRKDLSNLQTYFATCLGMERGKKSLKTHLNALDYKIIQKENNILNLELQSDQVEMKIDSVKEKHSELINRYNALVNQYNDLLKKKKEKLTPRETTQLLAYQKLKLKYSKIKELGEKMETEIRRVKKQGKSKGI